MRKFCDLYELRNLLREPTCFKNPDNLLCVNLFLTNCSRSFQDPQVIQTGLSDFSQNESSSFKVILNKNMKPFSTGIIKQFDNLKFKEALKR